MVVFGTRHWLLFPFHFTSNEKNAEIFFSFCSFSARNSKLYFIYVFCEQDDWLFSGVLMVGFVYVFMLHFFFSPHISLIQCDKPKIFYFFSIVIPCQTGCFRLLKPEMENSYRFRFFLS